MRCSREQIQRLDSRRLTIDVDGNVIRTGGKVAWSAMRGFNHNPELIARACEEVLLSLGRSAEAYERYAIAANRGASYVAAFRAIVRKYPAQEPQRVLRDLVARTPEQEGKWFAAAKEAGLLEMAIGLANQSPCDPRH
jgi:hypothetical protein